MKKKGKALKIVFITTVCLLLISGVGVSVYTGLAVFDGVTQQTTNERTLENQANYLKNINFNKEEFESRYGIIENRVIYSTQDGHGIPADYIRTPLEQRKGVAILVHGLGGTRMTTYPVAEMFLELGYDVLAYDQMRAGENLGEYNTFGFLESYDLLDCVSYVDKDLAADEKLAVWGCSFGGATVGIALGRDDSAIDYAVLDCAISDGEYLIRKVMEEISVETGLPLDFMMFTGNLALKAKLGFGFSDLLVTDWVKETSVPMLVFNTEIDEVTPAFMGQDLYDAVSHDKKKIVTMPDSKHAEIFQDQPEAYKAELAAFLQIQ